MIDPEVETGPKAPKAKVAGSNPVFRSNFFSALSASFKAPG
jgi:hypothetical protein